MKQHKIPKYIWMPAILLIYFAIMTAYFGRDLIASHQTTRLTVTCAIESLVIVGVFFSLRGKARIAEKRNNNNDSSNIS